MARNKYPEQTKSLIIEEAFKLFKERGFDQVVMQDIIDQTKLSRGAVYHHFKNKQDIMQEVVVMLFNSDLVYFEQMMQESLSAMSRIDSIIDYVTTHPLKKELAEAMWVQQNPQVLYVNIQNTINHASTAIEQIINQAMDEGICNTKYPRQAAQLMMLLMNIWLDPTLFPVSIEECHQKIDFMIDTLSAIGVSLISLESQLKLKSYYQQFIIEQ